MKKIRKEVWLTPEVVEALQVKADKDNRLLKSYMESVLIEDVADQFNYKIVILRKYFNEVTEETMSGVFTRSDAEIKIREVVSELENNELNQKRWPNRSVRLLGYAVYASNEPGVSIFNRSSFAEYSKGYNYPQPGEKTVPHY